MTKGELVRKLEKYDDDTLVVITLKSKSGGTTFDVHEEIGEGWLPSGVVELSLGDFVTG